MKKTVFLLLLLLVCLLSSCYKQNNESLLEAYNKQDYVKCLKILQKGADGRIDYSKKDIPLLFDIYQKCQKYLYDNNDGKRQDIERLFNFYLKNRKVAFEDSIEGVYPKQTVGSYLSRFASVELLRQIVQEKINISSPYERNMDSAIYELSRTDTNVDSGTPIYSKFYKDLAIRSEEKKIRMELLLDAGADVTLINQYNATIFHYFGWSPFEEDYTELLDKIAEKGADLFKKDNDGDSCINYMINGFTLRSNTEAYLEYVISRGLYVTKKDIVDFASRWDSYMESDKVTETELRRLERIKKILKDNVK